LEQTLQKENLIADGNIPRHIAIIMDGNGRWARRKSLPRVAGHKEGINSVRQGVEACGELNVGFLTLYTFSKENWNRPKGEVAALMRLLLRTVRAEVDELEKNNVRLGVIGHLDDLPLPARKGMEGAIKRLNKNTGLYLNLALSYSSRREITDCIRNLCTKVVTGELKPEDVSEHLISQNLYTAELPDPDLLIRTSGELRISNFLLWQLAYTEIYVTDTLWPDFRREELYKAISAFQRRERRFGKVSEQLKTDEHSIAQSVH
jgi:undecaprenyl diphosphate synthase